MIQLPIVLINLICEYAKEYEFAFENEYLRWNSLSENNHPKAIEMLLENEHKIEYSILGYSASNSDIMAHKFLDYVRQIAKHTKEKQCECYLMNVNQREILQCSNNIIVDYFMSDEFKQTDLYDKETFLFELCDNKNDKCVDFILQQNNINKIFVLKERELSFVTYKHYIKALCANVNTRIVDFVIRNDLIKDYCSEIYMNINNKMVDIVLPLLNILDVNNGETLNTLEMHYLYMNKNDRIVDVLLKHLDIAPEVVALNRNPRMWEGIKAYRARSGFIEYYWDYISSNPNCFIEQTNYNKNVFEILVKL